jgi:single-stranded-DNA-specific exonuclease
VIGIVASRMVERYHRPCVLVTLEGDRGRGSGRSISAYDLHAGLTACSDRLLRFGGHRAAAGLEIAAAEVDAFRDALVAHAASVLSPGDLVPVERVDAVVGPDRLGVPLAEELERLRPFGHGNPAPTLLVPAARLADVRSMGDEQQHSRFTIAGGGARARAVAFRTAAGSLPSSLEDRHDAAVRLELNEWNGTVEPRLVLRALCPTEPGECRPIVAEPSFMEAIAQELDRDGAVSPMKPGSPRRTVRDRRGEGFAGVAGDLLSSGESVALVCADAARRRAGLELVVGGIVRAVSGPAAPECPALVSWDDLLAEPALASPYRHLLALDPPLAAGSVEALAASPADGGEAFVHLAWGEAEIEFALALARAELDLRPAVTAVYRALRELGTDSLEEALRATGARPRACARALRVLEELGLAELQRSPGRVAYRLLVSDRTELDRSSTYRLCQSRLHEAQSRLPRAASRAA